MTAHKVPDEHTALYKYTVSEENASFAGEVIFLHAYHDHPVNAALHTVSMGINLYMFIVGPALLLLPFSHRWIQACTTIACLLFYTRFDTIASLIYASVVYFTFESAIYLGVSSNSQLGWMLLGLAMIQQVIVPLTLGHRVFQEDNAAFRWKEALVYANFYFVIRTLKSLFHYMGYYEELHYKPPPKHVQVGAMGSYRNTEWENWCGNSKTIADTMFFPSTLEDLQNIVHQARENNKKIRVVGKGHSFNGITACDNGDYLVRTDWLRGIQVDVTNLTATVECGVTVNDLDLALEKLNLCVPTNVLLKCVTYGGIMQTGSHGCGYSPMNDWIESMIIVDGTGQVQHLKDNTGDAHMQERFNASILGLGLCGLVYSITFKVRPMRNLQLETNALPQWPTAEKLAEIAANCDQYELFDFAQGPVVSLRKWTVTNKKPGFVDRVKYVLGGIYCHIATSTQLISVMHKFGELGRRMVHFGMNSPLFTRVLNTPRSIHFLDRLQDSPIHSVEFAMRVQDVDKAYKIVQDMCREYKMRGEESHLFTVECRTTPHSKALMNPACLVDEPIIAWFELIGFRTFSTKNQGFYKFAREFSLRILEEIPCALPHWAKNWDVVPRDYMMSIFTSRYGQRLEKFRNICHELDPDSIFLNHTTSELLGREEAPYSHKKLSDSNTKADSQFTERSSKRVRMS